MNVSFELLSSMSPKVNKYQTSTRKTPTVLALKKYFRKSIDFSNVNNLEKDISVISIRSSSISSSASDDSENQLNATPIIISDSEKSFNKRKTPKKSYPPKPHKADDFPTPSKKEARLSKEKYTDICHWVDEVNSAKKNLSSLSEVSSILGGDNPGFKKPETNVAVSSSLLHSNVKRFDELFCKRGSNKKSNEKSTSQKSGHNVNGSDKNLSMSDSLDAEDNIEDSFQNLKIDDSFKVIDDESLSSRVRKKIEIEQSQDISIGDSSEYENLLDSLYGNSWRVKKDDVLPQTEPRKAKSNKQDNIPLSERHTNQKNDNNLLKILQKARFKKTLESPWAEKLKNIIDSDTESDNSGKCLHPVKLNFEDDYSNNSENKPVSEIPVERVEGPLKEKKKKKTNDSKVKDKNFNSKNKSANTATHSFLASLSGSVPIEQSDISALIFRKNFKQHKESLAIKLFNIFNTEVFENAIPEDTAIEWSDRMVRTAGTCTCKKITRRNGDVERTAKIILSSKVLDSADRLRDTLIHEMCHAATWIVNKVSDGHGLFWKSWAHRAMKTFPELPPIKRCHNYVINTKYTYRCTGCGYSIGRHTKSLDVERKRCGYCLGSFEILINKISKQGETKSVLATPKKVTGFALFVKENYANYKTPGLKHGDVMKILGQKFASLKVDNS